MPVLDNRTTSLEAYPTAAGEGQTVLCGGYDQAAREIQAIKAELAEKFGL